MTNVSQHYHGYAVQPYAHCLPDGYFSANLALLRTLPPAPGSKYEFFSLDYFRTEAEAMHHSRRWARDWIDQRG